MLNPLDVHACILNSNLSYICNQIVATTMPCRESLDHCSHGFIMSSYTLLANFWVHAAAKDVVLCILQ